ncbi:hypothetical protein [Streptomyces sp. A5-4]|uniref:hypothetical protein n=1 Tax=Streptomyces sp. A5-4 TaxID=3384771 RepID=UPI003DA7F474
MNATRWWSETRSVVAWWALVTAALFGLGHAGDRTASLLGCAASAAFFVALGEACEWLRRRYANRRPHRLSSKSG